MNNTTNMKLLFKSLKVQQLTKNKELNKLKPHQEGHLHSLIYNIQDFFYFQKLKRNIT